VLTLVVIPVIYYAYQYRGAALPGASGG
jgi:hypothetical protein